MGNSPGRGGGGLLARIAVIGLGALVLAGCASSGKAPVIHTPHPEVTRTMDRQLSVFWQAYRNAEALEAWRMAYYDLMSPWSDNYRIAKSFGWDSRKRLVPDDLPAEDYANAYLDSRQYAFTSWGAMSFAYLGLVRGPGYEGDEYALRARDMYAYNLQVLAGSERDHVRLRERADRQANRGREIAAGAFALGGVALAIVGEQRGYLEPEQAREAVSNVGQLANSIARSGSRSADQVARVVGENTVSGDGTRMVIIPSVGLFTTTARFVTADGHCTASLIETQIVVTNAHCVTDERGNLRGGLGSARVVFNDLHTMVSVPVTQVILSGGDRSEWWRAQYASPPEFERWADDWAVLRLAYHPRLPRSAGWRYRAFDWQRRPLTAMPSVRDFLGDDYLETGDGFEGEIALSGHSGDLNDGRFQSLHWGCRGESVRHPTHVQHGCRGAPGASGSPVFGIINNFDGADRARREGTLLETQRFRLIGLKAYGFAGGNGGGGPSVSQFREAVLQMRRRVGAGEFRDPFEVIDYNAVAGAN
ncbi:hypothetical protein J2T57_001222 [Natronocella acetinitrilica]|uniref:Peptidase S1 domain-containing protein n=1 Tax=Natronocella acetinitrilica TaxID=414046 RepID=A0AAE3KAD0_9GAMM|nr:trypsin-like serine protease [Natronocella acetinitrilica]MCP1674120.1 hypothetical protein [Natronocella acetinitrilica]